MPGILHVEKSPAQLSHAHLTQTFAVNTIGPLLLFKHFSSFLPTRRTPLALAPAPAPTKERASTALPAHAVWLNMAARVGSTSDNVLGGWYSYRASKAGVVSATRGEDVWVRARAADRAMVVAYHPGTVRTGLSEGFWATVPEGKLFGVEDAVRMMVGVVCGLGVAEGRGRCWDWEGKEILP
jgi:NAD(P)-dependent dehydrogenase (short-subunit alcohol dehydrogenase family)